jgi:hypothetical protein
VDSEAGRLVLRIEVFSTSQKTGVCHEYGYRELAVAKAEQHADLHVLGAGQKPFRLVRAHDKRNLLWLPDVVNLGSKV